MLENLVSKFQFPCIMDLKMGNRLQDDDASQTKRESHQNKVNETTSGILGLRITGIQVRCLFSGNHYHNFSVFSVIYRSTIRASIDSFVTTNTTAES